MTPDEQEQWDDANPSLRRRDNVNLPQWGMWENELGFTCDGYGGRCTCQAIYVVHMHNIDHCASEMCGVLLLCPQCTIKVGQRMSALLMYLHQISGEDTTCLTCEKPLADIGDMFVAEKLRSHSSA